MTDELIERAGELTALAATCAGMYYRTLRDQGLSRREATLVTVAWVGSSPAQIEVTMGSPSILHGQN